MIPHRNFITCFYAYIFNNIMKHFAVDISITCKKNSLVYATDCGNNPHLKLPIYIGILLKYFQWNIVIK